ncbi:MAG: cytochrome c [Pseudomonadota bacterium]|nr:cytochrome c [Pseudomonadota bacterium]
MRKSVLIAVATVSLLGACRQGEQARARNEAAVTNADEPAAPAPAAPVTPEQAQALFQERHEGMETIGKSVKTIKQSLDSGSPDMGAIHTGATKIEELAGKSSGWFPPGTGKDVLPKTRALPAIWEKSEDFASKDRNLQQAAQALKAAADSGDLGAIQARFADLGKTCKACHDSYRAEKHPD